MAWTKEEEARIAKLEELASSTADIAATHDSDIAGLKANSASKADLEDAASPFVGFVLNNWQTRPALLVPTPEGGTGAIVFTAGAVDGAEYERGVIFIADPVKSNSKHRPGTWHDSEG